MDVSTLDQLEAEKIQSRAIFASDKTCAKAIRTFITKNRECGLHLMLLETGTGLSLRRRLWGSSLAEQVVDRNDWPPNVRRISHSSEIDPALLSSVSQIIWFFGSAEPDFPKPQTGPYSCAMNAAMGLRYGLPLTCYDAQGMPIPSPLVDAFADFVNTQLAEWSAARRTYTRKIQLEGIVLAPDCCEPAMWSAQGGAIDAGDLELSLPLIWRLRRLENAIDRYDPDQKFTPEDEKAFATELEFCAEALRFELGTHVSVNYGRAQTECEKLPFCPQPLKPGR